MSKIFFIADTHFGHENIIKYCDRPFRDVHEMNKILIENWNRKVRNEDKVFVLGDFMLGSALIIQHIVSNLRGNKVLILGNHDRHKSKAYLDAGFKEVYKHPILWNDRFLLSHEPKVHLDLGSIYNIYGHIHNHEVFDINKKGTCVSVEQINYEPISYEEILKKIQRYNDEGSKNGCNKNTDS